MAWTIGIDVVAGNVATASEQNKYTGAGGNHDFLSDGTSILNQLVYESSMKISNAPVNGKLLAPDSASAGGLKHLSPQEIHSLVSRAF